MELLCCMVVWCVEWLLRMGFFGDCCCFGTFSWYEWIWGVGICVMFFYFFCLSLVDLLIFVFFGVFGFNLF